jgi:hypothetical protein
VINYEELPEKIKTKKSTEEDAYENVTWEDIIEDFQEMLADKDAIFVIDNFPPASLIFPEEGEGNDYVGEIRDKFLPAVGKPYVTLSMDIS